MSGMVICPKCKQQVLPKANGTCPSCLAILSGDARAIARPAAKVEAAPVREAPPARRVTPRQPVRRESGWEGLKTFFQEPGALVNNFTAHLAILTWLVMLLVDPIFRQFIRFPFKAEISLWANINLLIRALVILLGLALSFLHVYTRRAIPRWERVFMGSFLIASFLVAGMQGFLETWQLKSFTNLVWIFALLDLLVGFIFGFKNWEMTFPDLDERTPIGWVIVGILLLGSVYALTYKALNLSWAVTFAVCMFTAFLLPVLGKFFRALMGVE